ncbi:DUF819 family protein [Mangrovivirga halotolerans]|uniref:DUF819 family protein n=1 Tax=Mangrovivirga halotolerans TaxID=2993936 RepID=UPI0034E1D3E3
MKNLLSLLLILSTFYFGLSQEKSDFAFENTYEEGVEIDLLRPESAYFLKEGPFFIHLDDYMEVGKDSLIIEAYGLETIPDKNYIRLSGSRHEKIKVKIISGEETIAKSFYLIKKRPLIQNDAVVFGLLMFILGLIFYTSGSKIPFFKKFYSVIPALLLCYFIPSLLSLFGIVNASLSNVYYVASRFMLPAGLVLLTLSIDFKEVLKLGPKALIMFFTATISIIIGGPVALWLAYTLFPGLIGEEFFDTLWRGMSTVAGSWIGGGANQAAMYEVFKPSGRLYSVMIAVDVLVAELWMAFLLIGAARTHILDKKLKADTSAIDNLKKKMEDFSLSVAKIPSFRDMMIILSVAFTAVAIGHFVADNLAPWFSTNFPDASRKMSLGSSFFWLIIVTTTIGFVLSFTQARKLEGSGASKFGSIFIYILVASIGMQMDVGAVVEYPQYFLIGLIWMSFHVIILLVVAKIIKAPFFFVAVGSKANIGGAASAPVVAAAFHPSLAPVGVLLAVLGYALGTYGAYICALLMQAISG